MRFWSLVSAGLTSFAILLPPLAADWVEMKNGVLFRGVDFKEGPRRSTFTLEDGRTAQLDTDAIASVRSSPPGEKLEVGGRLVTLREKVRLMKQEELRRRGEALRSLEAWARGKKEAQAGRDSFAALPAEDRTRYLAAALLGSKVREARVLAARELSRDGARPSGAPSTLKALCRSAVTDPQEPVRAESLSSLRVLGEPGTADELIPFLKSPAPRERMAAARALTAFPSRRAVAPLIEALRLSWSGFGRSYFFQGEERSYIGDYELVSGGTGFSIVEVADPVIMKSVSGVVLDVKVTRVEVETHRQALRQITGQDFGTDAEKWRQWWSREAENNPGSPARPDQSSRAEGR